MYSTERVLAKLDDGSLFTKLSGLICECERFFQAMGYS